MNHEHMAQMEQRVEQVIRPIVASPARKRRMREELLAHVVQIYEQELGRGDHSEQLALGATQRRFGDRYELRQQLQEAVPFFEQSLFELLGPEERMMSRILWIVAVSAIFATMTFAAVESRQIPFALLAALGGIGFVVLCHKENAIARYFGPGRPWFAAGFAIPFGPAVILPALAKWERFGFSGKLAWPLTLGVLITLAGLGLALAQLFARRARTA